MSSRLEKRKHADAGGDDDDSDLIDVMAISRAARRAAGVAEDDYKAYAASSEARKKKRRTEAGATGRESNTDDEVVVLSHKPPKERASTGSLSSSSSAPPRRKHEKKEGRSDGSVGSGVGSGAGSGAGAGDGDGVVFTHQWFQSEKLDGPGDDALWPVLGYLAVHHYKSTDDIFRQPSLDIEQFSTLREARDFLWARMVYSLERRAQQLLGYKAAPPPPATATSAVRVRHEMRRGEWERYLGRFTPDGKVPKQLGSDPNRLADLAEEMLDNGDTVFFAKFQIFEIRVSGWGMGKKAAHPW